MNSNWGAFILQDSQFHNVNHLVTGHDSGLVFMDSI